MHKSDAIEKEILSKLKPVLSQELFEEIEELLFDMNEAAAAEGFDTVKIVS